jgi:hypothetical protein
MDTCDTPSSVPDVEEEEVPRADEREALQRCVQRESERREVAVASHPDTAAWLDTDAGTVQARGQKRERE